MHSAIRIFQKGSHKGKHFSNVWDGVSDSAERANETTLGHTMCSVYGISMVWGLGTEFACIYLADMCTWNHHFKINLFSSVLIFRTPSDISHQNLKQQTTFADSCYLNVQPKFNDTTVTPQKNIFKKKQNWKIRCSILCIYFTAKLILISYISLCQYVFECHVSHFLVNTCFIVRSIA